MERLTFKQWRQYRTAVKKIEGFEKRFIGIKADGLYDPLTNRGSADDRTTRLRGRRSNRTWGEHLELYRSNGFIRNIIKKPAEDATREGITVKTNLDKELDISRLIMNRMEKLQVQKKIRDLIRYSRMYKKGSWLYYGVIADIPQEAAVLKNPLPLKSLQRIDFINVIDNPDRVSLINQNMSEPLKRNYKKFVFRISGIEVHESRFSWLVNDFIPEDKEGESIIDVIFDAISAQDSALWSTSSLVQDMATKIFKSDLIANLPPEKQAELLSKLKSIMVTLSSIALTSDEDFNKLTYNVTGMSELFNFIFDNLAGVADIPKNILLGKAHGVVTAGEYDVLNYYASIAQGQENDLRPIYRQIIDLVIHEKEGEVYQALQGDLSKLDWDFTFNSLWRLDPAAQADVDLKFAQRDQIDMTIGKASSDELRELDPRYSELEDVTTAAQKEVQEIINAE